MLKNALKRNLLQSLTLASKYQPSREISVPFARKKAKMRFMSTGPGQLQQDYPLANSSETQMLKEKLLLWIRLKGVPSVCVGRVTIEQIIALLQQRVSRSSPVKRMGVARNIIGFSTGRRTPT